jgi:hypothetical protein
MHHRVRRGSLNYGACCLMLHLCVAISSQHLRLYRSFTLCFVVLTTIINFSLSLFILYPRRIFLVLSEDCQNISISKKKKKLENQKHTIFSSKSEYKIRC